MLEYHQQSIRPSSDSTHHGRSQKMKSLTVIAYNNEKTGIDKSDQIIAKTIRKIIKWYRKLALYFLLETTIVNAYIVYQKATNKKMEIRKFRELLVRK